MLFTTDRTRDELLALAVARAKAEILDDIADGRVPHDVAAFSELHDYVDANEYGGVGDDWPHWYEGPEAVREAVMDFHNQVQDAVHAWLRHLRTV